MKQEKLITLIAALRVEYCNNMEVKSYCLMNLRMMLPAPPSPPVTSPV